MTMVESIKRARKAAGMSLTQVAKRSGVHRMAVANAERPDVDPRASTVAAIADALGVPVCELFETGGHEHRRRDRRRK